MKTKQLKTFYIAILLPVLILSQVNLNAQTNESRYFPKGNPDQWNVNLTPFLLVPNISGNVQSEQLSEEFGLDPAQFVNSLSGAFMMAAEISKAKFFIAPAYIYTHNEVEKTVYTVPNGKQDIEASLGFKKNIFELKGGLRLRIGEKFLIDPYVGFRYTNYYLYGPIVGIKTLAELDEKQNFWDPIIGFQAHFYILPRLSIELKTDVGGFGVGSELTWSALSHIGYAVSPSIDLLVGFAVLENQYKSNTSSGKEFGLASTTYGFDLGVRFFLPGRYKDPLLFKK